MSDILDELANMFRKEGLIVPKWKAERAIRPPVRYINDSFTKNWWGECEWDGAVG